MHMRAWCGGLTMTATYPHPHMPVLIPPPFSNHRITPPTTPHSPQVAAMKVPGFGIYRQDYYTDIAIATGATFVAKEVIDRASLGPACSVCLWVPVYLGWWGDGCGCWFVWGGGGMRYLSRQVGSSHEVHTLTRPFPPTHHTALTHTKKKKKKQTGLGLDKVTIDMLGQAQKAVLRQEAATILLTGKNKVRPGALEGCDWGCGVWGGEGGEGGVIGCDWVCAE